MCQVVAVVGPRVRVHLRHQHAGPRVSPRACPGTGDHRAARGGRQVQHRNGSPGLHNLHDHLFFTDLEFGSHSFSNIHHTVLL